MGNLTFPGVYFDGQTATRWPVSASVVNGGLCIEKEDGQVIIWPRRSFARASGHYTDEQIRFLRQDEALVVDDPALLKELGVRQRHRIKHAVFAVGALGALLLGAYFVGIPVGVRWISKRVPLAWESQAGVSVAETLAPLSTRCTDPDAIEAVQAIVDRLMAKQPPTRHPIRAIIACNDRVNAFAAPGGYIVVMSGLLAKTRRPEDLAGILAHELTHVMRQHPEQSAIRALGVSAVLAVIAGDFSTLANVATSLTKLRYSREDEQTADREGMALMIAAEIDPQGMIDAFRILAEVAGSDSGGLSFLSTHPQWEERISLLRTQTEVLGVAGIRNVPLLPSLDWTKVQNACAGALRGTTDQRSDDDGDETIDRSDAK